MLTLGQITPDSPFGKALTEYAAKSETILEIGFGSGLGSTLCLMAGMTRPSQRLTCIEGDIKQFEIGLDNVVKHRVNCVGQVDPIYGVLHNMIRPYWHPVGTPAHKEEYDHCLRVAKTTPVLHQSIYEQNWDFVVLDGGEYSSDADFLLLWPFAKVMALDDIHPDLATKNIYATAHLAKAGWKLEQEGINNRNGWMIFRKP